MGVRARLARCDLCKSQIDIWIDLVVKVSCCLIVGFETVKMTGQPSISCVIVSVKNALSHQGWRGENEVKAKLQLVS